MVRGVLGVVVEELDARKERLGVAADDGVEERVAVEVEDGVDPVGERLDAVLERHPLWSIERVGVELEHVDDGADGVAARVACAVVSKPLALRVDRERLDEVVAAAELAAGRVVWV